MNLRDRVGAFALAAVAVLLAALLASGFDDGAPVRATPSIVSGVLLADGPGAPSSVHRTVDRVDATARTDGPASVIVRRQGGSLRRSSAVVTWPVERAWPGRSVRVGTADGTVAAGIVTWHAGGAIARVRGDLPERDLLRIARATAVGTDRRPHVTPPAGMRVVWEGPYRPPVQREARYSATEVGEATALGAALVFTSVQAGAQFEDELFTMAPSRYDGVRVQGRRAVVAPTPGNGVLAWELRPGVVALVGWSGPAFGDGPVAALRRLASTARVLTPTQWQATDPQRITAPPAATAPPG